jgi:nickel-dependent lactate racemase
MLVLLVLVVASPSAVSCVMSRQNVSSSDVIIGRNTISPHYAYLYQGGHSSALHHQYEGELAADA